MYGFLCVSASISKYIKENFLNVLITTSIPVAVYYTSLSQPISILCVPEGVYALLVGMPVTIFIG